MTVQSLHGYVVGEMSRYLTATAAFIERSQRYTLQMTGKSSYASMPAHDVSQNFTHAKYEFFK